MNKETQTYDDKYTLGAKVEMMSFRNQQIIINIMDTPCNYECVNPMSSSFILTDRTKYKYFTGLYPAQFQALFNFHGPAKYELNYWHSKTKNTKKNTKKKGRDDQRKLDIKDQFFVALLRLRRALRLMTLAHMYSMSESYIRGIFTTWIMFLSHHNKDHKNLMFPARQGFRKHLPKIFKRFKNIKCSVDCTEFVCEIPRDYGKQGNTYSSYKHHCTVRCLFHVNPNGVACFVFDLYEGSIDDVAILEQCGILSYINPGDSL